MRFAFIARTIAGHEQRGTLEVPSLEEAREDLRKRNLLVEDIRAVTSEEPPPASFPAPPPLPGEHPLWTDIDTEEAAASGVTDHAYVPLTDTFRLFAGWLLAWYILVYLFGSLQELGRMPFQIPFVQSLFLSPIILRLAFGTYLFLLLTSLHRAWGKGVLKGILLTIVGVLAFTFFHVNV